MRTSYRSVEGVEKRNQGREMLKIIFGLDWCMCLFALLKCSSIFRYTPQHVRRGGGMERGEWRGLDWYMCFFALPYI